MMPDVDAQRAQIGPILSSQTLKTSALQRNLLTYLAEQSIAGTAQRLKEYTVGVDVFGKSESYDPRQESVVRMHVGRLRQKLAEYYRTEGVNDPTIIDLPKGGFALAFAPRPEALPPAAAAPGRTIAPREIALAATLLVAVVCAAYFGVRWARAERLNAAADSVAWTPELQQLWSPLLTSDRPLMVTLAADPSGVTGVGTANAAFVLGQFLGQRKDIFPIRGDVLSMDEIAMGDVIFVGPNVGTPQVQPVSPVETAFVLTSEGVRSVKPAPGEPAFLADEARSGAEASQETGTTYALISSLPGRYGNGMILYLQGNGIASVMGAVQAMTDPRLARELVARLKTGRQTVPRYYQVVLRIKAMDEMPVDIAYVLDRELTLSTRQVAGPARSQTGH